MSSILNSIFKKGTDCMGGSKVIFSKVEGANYTKGKKRLRGDPAHGPEVKKWNVFLTSNSPSSIDFVNNLSGGDNSTVQAYYPRAVIYPTQGIASSNRIGNRINLLGIRFKGWITLSPRQLTQIRWRLVLCRVDAVPSANFTFDGSAYLSQYANADTQYPTTWDVTRWNTFSRHNFYKKYKMVENKDFKAKVIASGCLPPTNTYNKLNINLVGQVGDASSFLQSNTSVANYVMAVHGENCGYIPIDVTVKINDNVDVQAAYRRYFVVLETDIGHGWNDSGNPGQSNIGMLLNMFGRGYFTDA